MPSYPQYVEAAAAARRVAGVKNVHNHLEVVLPPGDYRDDPTLTTTANNALAQNITVPAGVEASARNGRVTLTGTVRYGSERAAAEQTIAGLTGVRNIKNEIEIRSGAERLDVTLNVQDALNRYALIPDGSDVTVETSGNTVTLSGHVRTWAEHDAVVGAAWMTVGVLRRTRRAPRHRLKPWTPGLSSPSWPGMEDDMSDEQHGNPVTGQPGPA